MSNLEDEAANIEGGRDKPEDLFFELSDLEDISANIELDQSEVESLHSSESDADSSCQSSNCAGKSLLNPYSFRRAGRHSKRKRITAADRELYESCKEELDAEIARMFYSAGLPFNLAKNPHFIRAFKLATICNMERYDPPTPDALRGTLLHKERSCIEDELKVTTSTWENKGVSLVCSGWEDPERRSVVNFYAVNANRDAVFICAVDCQEECKDKPLDDFIYNSIKQVIDEIGADNVVQVITDNTPLCRSAGACVERAYPYIFWTPCIVHTLNLALKNMCAAKDTEDDEISYDECRWITEVSGEAAMIREFVVNHPISHAIYSDFFQLKLLAVAETRFATTVVLLKRLKLVKQPLRSMVTGKNWSMFCDYVPTQAKTVRQKVLDDAWWDLVDYILDFTEPIYTMLRSCDAHKDCLHLVYEMWGTMIFQVRKVIYQHERKSDVEKSSFWNVIREVLESRWYKRTNDSYGLAHSLNPRCTTKRWIDEHPYLILPQHDLELSDLRKHRLNRLFPCEDEQRQVYDELENYFLCLGEFANEDSIRDRWEMDPLRWWMVHGNEAPHLQWVSMKLLCQVSSASCCEKNWSTYSFIHSARKAKTNIERAKDMAFVHNNLRLMSTARRYPELGDSKMWDVTGDVFDFDHIDDVGILRIADLSLDEPELESKLLVDKWSSWPFTI